MLNKYIGISFQCSSNPEEATQDLDYGVYDFKYRGFVYTRNYFKDSVLQIESQNANGNLDTGTAYYIGNNMFVTAAHCVNDVARFNLLYSDSTPMVLCEVWFAKGHNREDFDLVIICVDGELSMNPFRLDVPAVLDDVLVMGFPPIANLPSIQTAETATIGACPKAIYRPGSG